MKNKFKLFGIIVMLAIIGFSMAACGGDDKIYGCAYSETESGVNWQGKAMTTYLLTITYDQARANITSKLGQPAGDAGSMSHNFKPPYVIVQVTPEANEVRLYEFTGSEEKGLVWDTK